jgi:hypothetical protein
MTTIEEIPIDVSEEALPEPDAVVEEPLSPIEEEEAPAPKKRGRPAGAKNRAKPKVVAKRKPRAPPPPPSEDEEEEDDEPDTPRIPLRRTHSRASAPSQREYEEEVLDARSVAAEMLQMLSRRNADKHHAKRAKYASWFPNNAVY